MSGAASNQQAAFGYAGPPYQLVNHRFISGNYTVQPQDNGLLLIYYGNIGTSSTVSIPPARSLPVGFCVSVWALTSGSNSVTIDPSGSETIDGELTLILRNYEGTSIICIGDQFISGASKRPVLYAENFDPQLTARPIASSSIGGVAIGGQASSTGAGSLAVGGSSSASGEAASGFGYRATASATLSTAIGSNSAYLGSQAVTGSAAMALGGSRASGTDSLAAAVANNTSSYGASGANSVVIGNLAKATGLRSVALGSYAIATATDAFAIATGTNGATSNSNNSLVIGNGGLSDTIGKYVYAGGTFAANGDAQAGHFQLRAATTDATATVATSNGGAASTNNQVILPNNSAYAFTGTVISRRKASDGTASAAWKVEGLIRREGTAASTTLVTSTVTAIDNTPGWTLALSADTTNGGLAVTFTGAAATNIRTVAAIDTTEVTYA